MRKHQDCEEECQLMCYSDSCEALGCDCYLLELEALRNMTPQERAGWIRAMDEGVD